MEEGKSLVTFTGKVVHLHLVYQSDCITKSCVQLLHGCLLNHMTFITKVGVPMPTSEDGSIIGASVSEPHMDGTTGRFHICIIIIIIIIVRPSPARRAWSHEVCRASNIAHSHT